MNVNKIVYFGKTLINLSNDTVTPEKLIKGTTAHDASGETIVGTLDIDEIYQKGYADAFELYKPYKQELLFLASSGTQFIDTGFLPNQDTRVVIETYCPLNSGSLCGAIGTGGTKRYGVYVGANYRNDYNTSTLSGSTTNVTNKFILDKNKNVQTVNGVSSTVTYAQFSVDKPLYLFAFNEWGTAKYFGSGIKIYSCKIYDNGTLVRDYIPVLDWDDVPCLYDKVHRKVYYNMGTGVFTYANAA